MSPETLGLLLIGCMLFAIFVGFPISFTLMAIEFSRFIFGDELMHSGEAGIHE